MVTVTELTLAIFEKKIFEKNSKFLTEKLAHFTLKKYTYDVLP